ncbi:MAG: HpcH/HpaI aldolase/citrate lyase family protein [Desulfarculaceae bacterium]|jgi:2-dehydro-3-deoxyglucarate aldolase/4-hydroxy-2-oxoheptanedioate aldolase
MEPNAEFVNPLKRKLANGKKTAGAWAFGGNPISIEILCNAGFDWLIIDMEHGPNDIGSVAEQIRAMKGTGVAPIVRAPWNDFVIIKRILDLGAYGVIIPSINTAEEAQTAVTACKYPPEGIRGIAASTRAARFGQNSMGYFTKANQEILVIVQIETALAVQNAETISQVEGVDGVFIGPMDLATSMGHLADPSHPQMAALISSVEEKVKKSHKFMGTVSASWPQAKELYERGYQFVTLLSDVMGLSKIANQAVGEFRKAYC